MALCGVGAGLCSGIVLGAGEDWLVLWGVPKLLDGVLAEEQALEEGGDCSAQALHLVGLEVDHQDIAIQAQSFLHEVPARLLVHTKHSVGDLGQAWRLKRDFYCADKYYIGYSILINLIYIKTHDSFGLFAICGIIKVFTNLQWLTCQWKM